MVVGLILGCILGVTVAAIAWPTYQRAAGTTTTSTSTAAVAPPSVDAGFMIDALAPPDANAPDAPLDAGVMGHGGPPAPKATHRQPNATASPPQPVPHSGFYEIPLKEGP